MYNCYLHGWSSHYSICPVCMVTETTSGTELNFTAKLYERQAKCEKLESRIEKLKEELAEQCRLNEMGQEREARLIAEITEKDSELERYKVIVLVSESATGIINQASKIKEAYAAIAALAEALEEYSTGDLTPVATKTLRKYAEIIEDARGRK